MNELSCAHSLSVLVLCSAESARWAKIDETRTSRPMKLHHLKVGNRDAAVVVALAVNVKLLHHPSTLQNC